MYTCARACLNHICFLTSTSTVHVTFENRKFSFNSWAGNNRNKSLSRFYQLQLSSSLLFLFFLSSGIAFGATHNVIYNRSLSNIINAAFTEGPEKLTKINDLIATKKSKQ